MSRTEIQSELSLLNGKIYVDDGVEALQDLLVDDLDILVRNHRKVTDTSVLKAMLRYLANRR